jgi:hypothetical protein
MLKDSVLCEYKGSLVGLDKILNENKEDLILMFVDKVNGLKVRVSTAVKIISSCGKNILVYRRTSDGEKRRGVSGKFDTPKGRVAFTAPIKMNIDEKNMYGSIIDITISTEENPSGKFAEFVFMPVIHFQVDQKTENYLNKSLNNVPDDMGDVERFEWVDLSSLNHENSMTKLL